MFSHKKQIIFLAISVLICVVFFLSIYNEVKQKTIQELNNRQMVYAELAANGIEESFNHYFKLLNYLTAEKHIIRLDNHGIALIRSFQKISADEILGITRLNAQGRVIYSYPDIPRTLGADVSGQEHVREILHSKKPVVSDVFTAVQGFKAIAVHLPVYDGSVFQGTLGFLISFDALARKHLQDIKVEKSGYAWMISAKGIELYCPIPGHSGNSVMDNCKDFPEIIAMAKEMMKGKKGFATYTFDKPDPSKSAMVHKHAAYLPLKIGNTFWSIVVATPEDSVLAPMKSFRNQLIIIMLILLIIFTAIAYAIARSQSTMAEQQKRRQIEDDLIRSAEEVQDLYHNAPCGYHSLDAGGNIIRINDMELSWLGYTREELIGKPYRQILTAASHDRFAEAFARIKEQQLVRDVEYEMVRKDGTAFPVLVTASAVTDAKGNFVMTRSMVLDITLRRKQEKRLRESEALYRTAMESTNDGVSILQDGKYVYANQKFLDTIGITDTTTVDQELGNLIHPDDRASIQEYYAKRLRGEPTPGRHEVRVLKRDNTILYLQSTSVDIIYREKPAMLTFVQDITEQKKTENALRESEALYRTALEATSDGVTILQEGKYVYVNQKFLDTLGVAREAVVNQPLGVLAGPKAQEGLKDFLLRHPQDGPRPDIYITRVRRADGTFIYLQSSSVDIIYQGKPSILTFIKDITERKNAEQALRESEALYRTALETTSDGISIIDIRTGTYLYANQRLMATVGRPGEDIIGRPVDMYLHPEDVDAVRHYFQAIKTDGQERVYYELRALKPDSTVVTLGVTATEATYEGKPAVISFITDITERKRTEEALRESEELYRTAIEKTNDGISIVQEGKYVYANQRLLKTLGREEKEVVNQPLGVYMDPDGVEMLRKYFVARIQGKEAPASYDIKIMKPDRSYILLNVKAAKITYKGKPATISFVTNVTERRRAEEALRQSEERYRTIIESIDDDYFETDLNGNITFFNKPFSCSGLSREEMLGSNYRIFTKPEMSDKIFQSFNQVYQTGKPKRMIDYEIIRLDGSIGHQEMSVLLIRDAEGKPAGFRGISRDVSERFRMEEESKRLTAQLHQAQKMEAIGTLAGGIAHDFNNLLMGIQGYTSLLLLDIDGTHPYAEQLKAIQSLVQSGASLTKQLLGFARAGRYEVVPTNLNDLIGKSINLFGRTRKEIRIFEKYAERIWTVEADRGQIEQVLLNMFVNAWQAMPGGGSLYLETDNIVMDDPLAKIHDLKPGRFVKISITDTGVGMDEMTRQRIFDPFFTTKEMGRGTGLGLASAYGIIKGHSGTIMVYSEKGEGTTFNIYLPASSKEVDSEEPAETELSGGRETILLVDDEEVIRDVTGRLLAELGYQIIPARNGEEALEIYAQRHASIDLVIIDMIMPGMSGSDTFDRIKAINPSVRTILSSGYSLNGKAQAIMDRGVRVFLQKPYRLHDIAQKIRQALAD